MDKTTKNLLILMTSELYEHSKEAIGEILEMDIEEIDYGTLEFESCLIIQLATVVEVLNEAEMTNALDSVDNELDLSFLKEGFDNKNELKRFLRGILCDMYQDDDEEIINDIVKLVYK